ncbi:MAG: zinc ABC transporter substrate-binding protein [Phycisphaerales bacterium]
MKRVRLVCVLSLGLLGLMVHACRPNAPSDSAARADRPVVMTTFYPLAFLAERIAGGLVDVECPLPEDADPATWDPHADVMRRFQSADLILINGASFEQWVARAPLPRSRVVDTTAAKRDELLRYASAITHSHGMGGTHSHEGIDGHTWLDPLMALAQAQAIADGMSDAFPEHADAFGRNLLALTTELRALDRELAGLEASMTDVSVICSHPAYNYLGRRYHWNLIVVPMDPAAAVKADDLEALRRAVESAGPRRIVLWESPTSDGNVAAIRDAIGAESVLYTPCEQPPAEGDFLSVMRENIERLRTAVSADG